ncbi:glycosyltransferase [Paenibacillus sp. LHD-117]|uniref:glycosyltransferase n=1 Tax=Paenibacillus sp. LHD-117 TaxID=3071412 RepID=UPI0027E05822|nr:glycosyltransferase [Paenibacillus sp. LHD-117]MDQ6423263.1 glycosyltransferase [Paenibacillus sp. LHD-117]
MKKRVLFTGYAMEIGGIERSLINMLEQFDYDSFDVDLIVFCHTGEFMEMIPKQVNLLPESRSYAAIRKSILECLRQGLVKASLLRVASKAAAYVSARRLRPAEGPGYIQMQYDSKWFAAAHRGPMIEYDMAVSYAWPHDFVAEKVRAKRKIAWIHTDFTQLEMDRTMDEAVWSRYENIISISEACTDSFIKSYPSLKEKIKLIENITSPAFIRDMAEQGDIPQAMKPEGFTIVSVGRLSYVKGFDIAILALKLLHDRGLTKVKWHVVGYGGSENELREQIARSGLENSFVLLGKQMNPYPFIKHCDLYVQPSRYEGKAVTVTEAQILHKPIIITNYPTATSQVVHGKTGIICECSAEGLADAIGELYANDEKRKELIGNLELEDYHNRDELEKLYNMVV